MAEEKKFMLALKGNEDLLELIETTCILIKAYKAKLLVLHVIEIPRTLPLEGEMKQEIEEGETLLAKAEALAEDKYEVIVETELLQARQAGPTIVELAQQEKFDGIIMGHRMSKGIRERLFGGTLDYVLKHAPCKIYVYAPPLRPKK